MSSEQQVKAKTSLRGTTWHKPFAIYAILQLEIIIPLLVTLSDLPLVDVLTQLLAPR